MDSLLLLHLCASIWMTAIIWFVQLVHYPSFDLISSEHFTTFHERHSLRTTFLVLVPMLVELGSAGGLAWQSGSAATLVLLGLTLVTWALTFLVSVPLHNRLSRGQDSRVISRLVRSNWLRTLSWSLKLGWSLKLLLSHGKAIF